MTTQREVVSSSRAGAFAALFLSYILGSLGCSGKGTHEKNEGGSMVENTRVVIPEHILKHNITSSSAGGWKLTTWTNGSAYSPGEPIALGLHLAFSGERPKSIPKASIRLSLTRSNDSVVMNCKHDVTFKEIKSQTSEWEAIIPDAFKTDSHRPGATILKNGDYLFGIVAMVNGANEVTPMDSLIKVNDSDNDNMLTLYRNETKHNITSSSTGGWKLTTWTNGSAYSPGEPIALGLHLAFSGERPKSIPKASIRLSLTRSNDSVVMNCKHDVTFKEIKPEASEWEAVIIDVFKTDSHRPGATILRKGDYTIEYTFQVDDRVSISEQNIGVKIERPFLK